MVDSADLDRIDSGDDCATAELQKVLVEPQLRDVPLLVLANKQDIRRAVPVAELSKRLGLYSLKRKWKIQSTIATQAQGLYEGLDWLAQTLGENSY